MRDIWCVFLPQCVSDVDVVTSRARDGYCSTAKVTHDTAIYLLPSPLSKCTHHMPVFF